MTFGEEVVAIIVALQIHEWLMHFWRALNGPKVTKWTSESDVYVVNNHATESLDVLKDNLTTQAKVAAKMDTASVLAACRKTKPRKVAR